ncbi:hypothetical protein FQA39_LY02213 [Lamprigera yunnana]|nr:hypothetical protein FQA39_LY02213 [Lamprigera yunnana]
MGLELKLPTRRYLKDVSKFRQEEMKRKINGNGHSWLQMATSVMLCLTALAAKTDRDGLIGTECTCIQNSLRQVRFDEALASHSNQIVEFQLFGVHERVQSGGQGNKSGASSELAKSVNESD